MTNPLHVTAPAGEPTLRIVREFEAPRRLVWEAFTQAEHMARWWGPRKYASEVKEYDVRPGGRWRIVQTHGAERHEFSGEFRIVEAPAILAWTFGYMNYPPLLETMKFEDLGERTRVVVEGAFPSVAERDGMIASGMESGTRESYERLDDVLVGLAASSIAG